MLEIEAVNHVGIRVRDPSRSTSFYALLGFELVADVGFAEGHPVILRHPMNHDKPVPVSARIINHNFRNHGMDPSQSTYIIPDNRQIPVQTGALSR